MAIKNLYVTEVTQKTTAQGEVVIIAHGTDNAVNKSTINADVLPKELSEMISGLNGSFKTLCPFGDDVNYCITGFKIRDSKSGNQEISFVVNIKTVLIAFEEVKTAWMEIRETDMATLQGGSYAMRERVTAVNSIVEQFNELQYFVRDHIADWLEMTDTPKAQLDIFNQPPPKELAAPSSAALEFHNTLKKMKEKDGTTVTISAGNRSVAF
jgi:hypothetical protein